MSADPHWTWLEERNLALTTMNRAYVRRVTDRPDMSDHMADIILHKSRYDCVQLPDHERNKSARWLREHNYGAMGGPLLPEGELPK